MRFRHCFDCGPESRSSFFVNMKFNEKLTCVWVNVMFDVFARQLQLQLLCIAIVT